MVSSARAQHPASYLTFQPIPVASTTTSRYIHEKYAGLFISGREKLNSEEKNNKKKKKKAERKLQKRVQRQIKNSARHTRRGNQI